MKPFLKYRGGKLREIKNFEHHIPDEFERYFEPFMGGGALFFHLEHPYSFINDVNEKLITTYKQVKYNYPKVKEQLALLQEMYEVNQRDYEERKKLSPDERIENKNEALYYNIRQEFNYPTGKWLEAVTYFFINKTSYSGMIRYNKQGEFNVPFGRYKNFNTDLLTDEHHRLLSKTNIYNGDYKDLFNLSTSNDFMFLDPPYDTIFSDYGNVEFTGEFGEAEHRELAEDFRNLNCKALMVISKTDLTKELYEGFVVDEYHKSYAVNIRNRFKSEAEHYVITNYNSPRIAVPHGFNSMNV